MNIVQYVVLVFDLLLLLSFEWVRGSGVTSNRSTERADYDGIPTDTTSTSDTSIRKETAEKVVSCSDYPTCRMDESLVRKALAKKSNQKACRHVKLIFRCQKSATEDCKKSGSVNSDVLRKMTKAYIHAEIHMNEICHLGSKPENAETKGGARCSEFRTCFSDNRKRLKATRLKLYQTACKLASRISKCSMSATKDCMRRGETSNDTLRYMDNASQKAKRVEEMSCLFTTTPALKSAIIRPGHFSKQVGCLDFAKCPQPDLDVIQVAKRTGAHALACKSVKPYSQCIHLAMEDCKSKNMLSDAALDSMENTVLKAKEEAAFYCSQDKKRFMQDEESASRQHFTKGRNVTCVDDNNGGCSHTCQITPKYPHYKCSCPNGKHLLGDNKTCSADEGDEGKPGNVGAIAAHVSAMMTLIASILTLVLNTPADVF